MTAVLVEDDPAGLGPTAHTIDQGDPLFRARALLAYGVNLHTHGVVTSGGQIAYGFAGGGAQYAGAGGFQRTFDIDESASGVSDVAFFGTLQSVSSTFGNRLELDELDCGAIQIIKNNAAGNYLATLALGGGTLEAKAFAFVIENTGVWTVEGLGFRPGLLLLGTAGVPHYGGPTHGSIGEYGLSLSIGATDGVSQWAAAMSSPAYLSDPARRYRVFRDNRCLLELGDNSLRGEALLHSIDDDGFRLMVYKRQTSIIFGLALADEDGAFSVFTGVEGDASLPTVDEADAVILASANTDDQDVHTGASLGIGAAVRSGAQLAGTSSAGFGHTTGRYWDEAVLALMHTPNFAGSNTLDAQAEVTGWGDDTVEIDWTTGGGAGSLFGGVSMRLSEAVGFDDCGVRGIYTAPESPVLGNAPAQRGGS